MDFQSYESTNLIFQNTPLPASREYQAPVLIHIPILILDNFTISVKNAIYEHIFQHC